MIGPAITELILSDPKIKARIGNGEKLYPISDYDKGADAIYYIVRAVPGLAKNGPTMTKWQVTLITNCKRYSASWELSYMLLRLFHSKQQKKFAGFHFSHINCTSITDEYEFLINGFGQTLQFEITTPSYQFDFD